MAEIEGFCNAPFEKLRRTPRSAVLTMAERTSVPELRTFIMAMLQADTPVATTTLPAGVTWASAIC